MYLSRTVLLLTFTLSVMISELSRGFAACLFAMELTVFLFVLTGFVLSF